MSLGNLPNFGFQFSVCGAWNAYPLPLITPLFPTPRIVLEFPTISGFNAAARYVTSIACCYNPRSVSHISLRTILSNERSRARNVVHTNPLKEATEHEPAKPKDHMHARPSTVPEGLQQEVLDVNLTGVSSMLHLIAATTLRPRCAEDCEEEGDAKNHGL